MVKHKRTTNTRACDSVSRPTAPALNTFMDALEADNRHSPNGKWSRVSAETLMQLMDATQNYYEAAVRANTACLTTLVGGLASGTIISAGIIGICTGIRRLRNRKAKAA